MNLAYVVADVRVQTVLHTARRRIIVVLPLAIVITRAGLGPRRRRLCRFCRGR